jgi:hypothetical protein
MEGDDDLGVIRHTTAETLRAVRITADYVYMPCMPLTADAYDGARAAVAVVTGATHVLSYDTTDEVCDFFKRAVRMDMLER